MALGQGGPAGRRRPSNQSGKVQIYPNVSLHLTIAGSILVKVPTKPSKTSTTSSASSLSTIPTPRLPQRRFCQRSSPRWSSSAFPGHPCLLQQRDDRENFESCAGQRDANCAMVLSPRQSTNLHQGPGILAPLGECSQTFSGNHLLQAKTKYECGEPSAGVVCQRAESSHYNILTDVWLVGNNVVDVQNQQ